MALPNAAGTGFKPQHFRAVLDAPLSGGFVEVHAENYLGAGGPPHAMLTRLREDHALSLHGIGLSIGGEDALDEAHLARIAALCKRYEPQSFSEHLAWSSHGGRFLADLLPLAYTDEALTRIAAHVDRVQTALQRPILIENPSTYLQFAEGGMDEAGFLSALVRQTGCGLLLDVNNVFVSATNHGYSALDYIRALPLQAVGEIHLAGHFACGDGLLIDTHGARVADAVWALYDFVLGLCGAKPTLIEWDNDVPDWAVLRSEALHAQSLLDGAALRIAS